MPRLWRCDMAIATAICLTFLIEKGSSLECYVCHDQDGNHGKCLKTIRTCEPEEDRCLSMIRWSIQPYWSQGAEKQYYISKRCATQHECDKEINGNMAICHYIWYEDWRCAECCQGDRCNYYVTLGAGSKTSSRLVIGSTLALLTIFANLSQFT